MRCDHGLRRQVIVETLLKDIFRGHLHPGQHLVTQGMASRFGVSHTPIREALIALAGLGVVELLPNRGAVVRQVTVGGVREVCRVRRALECEAVRGACGRIDPEELRSMEAEMLVLASARPETRPGLVEAARAADNRLHDAIADACGNRFLANELGRLRALFRAFRDVAWEHEEFRNDLRRIAVESREHLEIVEALIAGDRKGAARAMGRHILSGIPYWSRALARPAAVPNHSKSVKGEGSAR